VSEVADRLAEEAARTGRPLAEAVLHHVLEGLLRRVARLPHADNFVLRGGMLTRLWVRPTPRPVQDLDFVGTGPPDVEATARRFLPALADPGVDDGVCLDPEASRVRGIWQETAFPGVRLLVRAGLGEADRDVQIDVGFNDPLVPPAERLDYPTLAAGPVAGVWACRPETMVGWKLHGLAETGARRWRPKDLHDLDLITGRMELRPGDLAPAVAVAFASRGFRPADAAAVLGPGAWWGTKRARLRWEEFRRAAGRAEVHADLTEVVKRVADRLRPALARLPHDSPGEGRLP
jgi:hypothetical protein